MVNSYVHILGFFVKPFYKSYFVVYFTEFFSECELEFDATAV